MKNIIFTIVLLIIILSLVLSLVAVKKSKENEDFLYRVLQKPRGKSDSHGSKIKNTSTTSAQSSSGSEA